MKDFLENIVKHIVEQPESVRIEESEQKGRILFTIHVSNDDMGRLIGKGGKVINSVRMIMRVYAIRQDTRVRIDVADDQPQEEPQEVTEQTQPESLPPEEAVEQARTTVAPPSAPPVAQAQPPQPNQPVTPNPDPGQAEPHTQQPSAADFVGQPQPQQTQPNQNTPRQPVPQQPNTTLIDNSQQQ